MSDENPGGIGYRIRHLREARGITVTELARHVGVPTSRITEYENGKHKPERDKIVAIANALGVLPIVLTADDQTRQWLAPEFTGNPKPLKLDSIVLHNLYAIIGDGREPFDVRIKYTDVDLPLHPRIRPRFADLSKLVEERARAQGAAFWNGPIVRLLKIQESGSHQHPSGYELRGLELELAPVSWTEFSVLNTLLDEPGHFPTNPTLTIRETLVEESLLYRHPTDFEWCQLSNMMTICMMPVTTDGYGIIQRRSSGVSSTPGKLISGISENTHRWLDEAPANYLWKRVHPLRPAKELDGLVSSDYKPANGNVPSPYLTIARGFGEELALLKPLLEAPSNRVKFTGIVYDLSLFQPVLVGVVDLPYTAKEVLHEIAEHRGKDHSEWTELISVKLDRNDWQTRQRVSAIHEWDLGGLAALIMSINYAEAKQASGNETD